MDHSSRVIGIVRAMVYRNADAARAYYAHLKHHQIVSHGLFSLSSGYDYTGGHLRNYFGRMIDDVLWITVNGDFCESGKLANRIDKEHILTQIKEHHATHVLLIGALPCRAWRACLHYNPRALMYVESMLCPGLDVRRLYAEGVRVMQQRSRTLRRLIFT